MTRDTIVTKPYVVVWFPGTSDISLVTKKEFEDDLSYGCYQHDDYKYEEFDTFEEANSFEDGLWADLL